MKIPILSVSIFVLLCVISCAQQEGEYGTIASAPALNMAEASELARAMRDIHGDAKEWKKLIEKGELVNEPNDVYALIVSSSPTKPEVKGAPFEAMAHNFQNKQDAFFAASELPEGQIAYNNLVDACITCHQAYCTGPISTIRKLYVKVD